MRKFLALLIFTLFLGSFSYTLAQEEDLANPPRGRIGQQTQLTEEERAARTASQEARRAERLAEKCERIKTNLDRKITKYTQIRARRVAKFDAWKERLNKLADHLEDVRDLDVSALRTAIDGLDPFIANLLAKFDAFLAKLNEVKNLDCANLSDSSRSQVQSARTELQALKTAQSELIQYYRTSVLGALQALKDQAQAEGDEEE